MADAMSREASLGEEDCTSMLATSHRNPVACVCVYDTHVHNGRGGNTQAGVQRMHASIAAAVQTLPHMTRQQLQQLWQGTLQLVQGGSGPRPHAVQVRDADAMADVRTLSS